MISIEELKSLREVANIMGPAKTGVIGLHRLLDEIDALRKENTRLFKTNGQLHDRNQKLRMALSHYTPECAEEVLKADIMAILDNVDGDEDAGGDCETYKRPARAD